MIFNKQTNLKVDYFSLPDEVQRLVNKWQWHEMRNDTTYELVTSHSDLRKLEDGLDFPEEEGKLLKALYDLEPEAFDHINAVLIEYLY